MNADDAYREVRPMCGWYCASCGTECFDAVCPSCGLHWLDDMDGAPGSDEIEGENDGFVETI